MNYFYVITIMTTNGILTFQKMFIDELKKAITSHHGMSKQLTEGAAATCVKLCKASTYINITDRTNVLFVLVQSVVQDLKVGLCVKVGARRIVGVNLSRRIPFCHKTKQFFIPPMSLYYSNTRTHSGNVSAFPFRKILCPNYQYTSLTIRLYTQKQASVFTRAEVLAHEADDQCIAS